MPRGWPETPELESILKRDINLDDIHAEYDNLLRIAASIDDGYTSATYLLERLGSAARGSRLHRAGTQLGQLWRTVYLCDYSAQADFRRSINRLLVRGESAHQLQRAIHYGPIRAHRGRRREELALISGALTLLTNAVVAYNTWKLNEVVEGRRRVTVIHRKPLLLVKARQHPLHLALRRKPARAVIVRRLSRCARHGKPPVAERERRQD